MPFPRAQPDVAICRGAFRALLCLVCLACLPGCPSAINHRVKEINDDGVFLFSKGDYRHARESFELALTLTPQDAGLVYNLAQCSDRLGDNVRAEQYYTQCLELDPRHGQARHAYAALLYRLGRSAEANRMIDDWLAKEPTLADAHAIQGWRLRQQRAYPEALERLQHALSIDPGNRLALTQLGVLYEETNMPERALVLYERVLSRHPDESDLTARVRELKTHGVKTPQPD
ncbi:MAG: tetratricopeptide repeat protein [Gemmataceae bacterium]